MHRLVRLSDRNDANMLITTSSLLGSPMQAAPKESSTNRSISLSMMMCRICSTSLVRPVLISRYQMCDAACNPKPLRSIATRMPNSSCVVSQSRYSTRAGSTRRPVALMPASASTDMY